MSTDSRPDLTPEIGHVLFIDIVGYSKLLIDRQSEVLEALKQIVRESATVRAAKDRRDLIRLPTGDGMALVFRRKSEAPVECALELSRADKQHPELQLRMGIHSGPINQIVDVNERANVAGAGIDMAQRVMDCGDAGHILLSKRVADDLAPYPRWHSQLHDLGECEVKHGARLHLFNLYSSEFGNPALPSKLQGKTPVAIPVPSRSGSRWLPSAAILLVLLSLGGIVWWFATHGSKSTPNPKPLAMVSAIPEKSIAVLPFENLSEEKANAYFADGVQDEILTDLAKIADLKVISRTSVMQYRSGIARNMREIGKQLGVAYLLEGSVQRVAGEVRVNAQLIDARTDGHIWAQTYDRDLSDVFAIQSDIARSIADQLQAKLAPEEKTRLATKPTDNTEAYLLYVQANEMVHVAASKTEVVNADRLYAQAIALDPKFALAYARASMLNSLMYSIGRAPERKARARTLADEALRLTPDLGEAHLALGLCFYRLDANYEKALAELARAGAAMPNDAEILDDTGYIYRRQNRWREALDVFARARQLDPRRANFGGLPDTFLSLRQWAAASDAYNAGLKLEPQLVDGWVGLAQVQLAQSGNPSVARTTLERLPDAMRNKPDVSNELWDLAMLARDFNAAEKTALERPPDEFPNFEPKEFYQACIALAQGNRERADRLLEASRPLHEAGVRDHPGDPVFLAALSRLNALAGHKEDALREARRAVELCPESKDAVSAPLYATNLAFVEAWCGEKDEAITLLSRLLTTPAADRATLAHLRLSWEWDSLRQDPRFQKILEEPEPATVYN